MISLVGHPSRGQGLWKSREGGGALGRVDLFGLQDRLRHPKRRRASCFGSWRRQLLASQPWNYAFGADSALERFLLLDGKIVLLGSDHDAVTFLHYVEHVADFPGKRVARYQVPIIENGCRVWRAMEEFDSSGDGAHANWPDRFFAKIVDSLLFKTGNNGARVGNARTHLLRARELLDFALPVMEAVAADPLTAKESTGES